MSGRVITAVIKVLLAGSLVLGSAGCASQKAATANEPGCLPLQ